MKLKKFHIITLFASCLFFSCNPDPDNPISKDIAKNIVGNWLLASSTATEWATYEFTETSRVNAVAYENSKLQTGSGFYWIDEDKASVTGSYNDENGNTTYFDWIIDKVASFELGIKLYDNNQFIGNSAIYRILSTITVEVNSSSVVNFKAVCGTDDISAISVLDQTVVSASSTGEVNGLKAGVTYMTFDTRGGHAAIKIEVSPETKTFAELVVGTWIYDKPSEKEWQNTAFESNGYIDVKWANPLSYATIETADGYYNLSETDCSFTVTTPYGMKFNQTWKTEQINDFIWTYDCFSDNAFVGKYTGQRLLGTITMKPGETTKPDYSAHTFGYEISGYSSHDISIAKVNAETGEISAISYGRTYVDVKTSKGAGVYEVYVEQPIIPYDFASCVGKDLAAVKAILGDKPDYSTASMIVYFNPTSNIEMIGVSMDIETGLSKGVSVTFNSTVDVDAITAQLNKTYIPFISQTTDTYKVYMDTENRADATLGITWDITKLILTYVYLGK